MNFGEVSDNEIGDIPQHIVEVTHWIARCFLDSSLFLYSSLYPSVASDLLGAAAV